MCQAYRSSMFMLENVPNTKLDFRFLPNSGLGLYLAMPGLLTTWWVPEKLTTVSNQALTHLRHNLAERRPEQHSQRSLSKKPGQPELQLTGWGSVNPLLNHCSLIPEASATETNESNFWYKST